MPTLHDSLAHLKKATDIAKLTGESDALLGGFKIRLGDDFQQGSARPVEIDQRPGKGQASR